jgi:predicted 2-oxoglutarate/Fe(II)-dependent dioxygenase YbiX
MILELSNYVDLNLVEEIKTSVNPYINKNNNYNTYRDGNTVDISNNPELKTLDNKIHTIYNSLQRHIIKPRYSPIGQSADSGYQYHKYNPGEIAQPHADGEIDESFLRYASVILCLNTPKNGGELIFPKQNKVIKSEAGKVIVFPPYGTHTHYTTPSTDEREVIVSWFIYENIIVSNNV